MKRIKAFFIHLITIITALFYKLFHIEEKNKKIEQKDESINQNTQSKKVKIINIDNILPEEPNTLQNPHNETSEEAPNSIILELPKNKYETINGYEVDK